MAVSVVVVLVVQCQGPGTLALLLIHRSMRRIGWWRPARQQPAARGCREGETAREERQARRAGAMVGSGRAVNCQRTNTMSHCRCTATTTSRHHHLHPPTLLSSPSAHISLTSRALARSDSKARLSCVGGGKRKKS